MFTKIMLAALVASLGFGTVQTLKVAAEKELRVAAEVKTTALRLLLAGCNARAINLTEDKESDDAIDNLTDNELRVAPSRWMLDAGTSDRNSTPD
jgi:hypothetical protein